jgi:hypothetical protein
LAKAQWPDPGTLPERVHIRNDLAERIVRITGGTEMRSWLRVLAYASSVAFAVFAAQACGGSGEDASAQSCSRLQGTWVGQEIDPLGGVRGNATVVVQDDQVEVQIARIDASRESYTLTAT